MTDEEVDQIARENRLKRSKHEQKHLKKERNFAEFALGDAFKNMLGEPEKEESKSSTSNKGETAPGASSSLELKPIDPAKPVTYDNCEGFTLTTYAEIIPGYSGFNKNKKKKLRTKNQKKLEEVNIEKFEEWKNAQLGVSKPQSEPQREQKSKEPAEKPEEEKTEEEKKAEKLEHKKGRKIDERVKVKVCDLGNGCWTHHHFSSEIQTRQYRSPETIIGLTYGTSADIWSFACMIFEMITGDFLFEPRKGHNFDKDDDHLAQMMEILGKMPKNIAFSGRLSKRFFDKTGHLLKIRGLQHWPLKKVLMEKYRFIESESEALADFLLPMLEWSPEKRATAQEMLDHPWLEMEANYEYHLSERDYQVMMLKSRLNNEPAGEDNKEMSELGESDNDLFNADCEDFNSTMEGKLIKIPSYS